ncbi:MAG: ATP-binding cassette domain-containing protein [Aestuariivirga sp.]|uniref:ATP-binding cassette domain-containing protein n=1 Tax=Aestuariivirga sp. TaxID=2650926 RepID=UPI0038D22D86
MALTLEQVTVSLRQRPLIKPFSVTIGAGEIVTLMGPSGSGKSTLLSFIAGDLEAPFEASGAVSLGGRELTDIAPARRRIGRLFQDDLLFPHMTVAENLLFGMPRGEPKARQSAMEAALDEAGLAGFAERPPHTLSGGQRARVALLRSLLANPGAMLLDEPFNKLDADLRAAMRNFVFNHIAERGIPCLLVTHDVADVAAGGRLLLLDNGEIRDA